MPRAVDLDRVVAVDRVGAVEPRVCPAQNPMPVVAAEKNVVRDVEVLRPRVLRVHSDADVLDPAVSDRQALRARHVLHASPECHFGVANRQALEDVVFRAHHVEETKRAVAVEDRFAVTCRANHDRPLGGAFGRQQVRPVECRAHRVHVVVAIAFVEPSVHKNHVSRLRLVLEHDVPVTRAGAGIGRHQTREVRLLLRSLPRRRIDMEHAAAGCGLRLAARSHFDVLYRLTAHTIRIAHRQTDFILGVR